MQDAAEAAKKLAENVTQSNVSAIITVLLFLVFILVMFYLNSKQKEAQESSMTKRDEMLAGKFGSLLEESNRKYAQMIDDGNRKSQQTVDQFTRSVEGMHAKQEEMGKQMMGLMVKTVETLAVVGEMVRNLKEEFHTFKQGRAKKSPNERTEG